jgi:hypothetical protein
MMGKIKRANPSDVYLAADSASRTHSEKRDCAVIALTVVSGHSYDEVREALKKAGRKDNHGTFLYQVEKAAELLGFKLEMLPYKWQREMIQTYPGGHKNAQHLTTHHPRRFAKQWKDVEPLLFHVDGHFAGFREGAIHDWSVNSAKRVINLYRLVKN